eukprot:c19616_g1_i1 orf=89-1018(+)
MGCCTPVSCSAAAAAASPPHSHGFSTLPRPRPRFVCSMQIPKSTSIKVVVNGACKEVGKAAIAAVTKARGMQLAGAVDTVFVGKDAGEVANLDEALEIPISNDLVMVLGSLSQVTTDAVMLDFTEPFLVTENVRQAAAFGLRSVVGVPGIELQKVSELSKFCEKASMGCIIAPTLSIGSILLQQAAIAAAFHFTQVDIVESMKESSTFPSCEAMRLADNLSGMGRVYNRGDISTNSLARGAVVGDGVRIHSLSLPGLVSSTTVYFSGPGEVLSLRHDVTDVQALIPGLLMAIRRVIRLKSLVYGLEKIM